MTNRLRERRVLAREESRSYSIPTSTFSVYLRFSRGMNPRSQPVYRRADYSRSVIPRANGDDSSSRENLFGKFQENCPVRRRPGRGGGGGGARAIRRDLFRADSLAIDPHRGIIAARGGASSERAPSNVNQPPPAGPLFRDSYFLPSPRALRGFIAAEDETLACPARNSVISETQRGGGKSRGAIDGGINRG